MYDWYLFIILCVFNGVIYIFRSKLLSVKPEKLFSKILLYIDLVSKTRKTELYMILTVPIIHMKFWKMNHLKLFIIKY